MGRAAEHVLDAALFYNFALFHHGHLI